MFFNTPFFRVWKWIEEEQKTLDKLKQALTGDRVMSYFDPRKETKILVDESPVGLGGLLAQDGKIICYASRALSEIERRYSQTEREIHAAVWALEHFYLNVYGATFSIITDHKLLLGIFKSSTPTSARIDRWKLTFMPYDCQLICRPGKDTENLADFISRHPKASESQAPNLAQEYINYMCNNAVPKAMTIHEVKAETGQPHKSTKL